MEYSVKDPNSLLKKEKRQTTKTQRNTTVSVKARGTYVHSFVNLGGFVTLLQLDQGFSTPC